MAQQVTLAETTMAVLGEGGVIRDAIRQIEAAEPAICQVQMHLLAKPPLGSDAEAITHQQHPYHQLWID